jgi:hypothetical protein
VIKEFSIGCSRTINLGNFESLRVEASVTMDVSENVDLQSCKEAAQVELRALLEDTYRAQHRGRMERMKREPVTSHGYGEQPDRDNADAASQ